MRPKKLRSKLLVGVAALVLASGLLISLLVTQRYSRSLADALAAQARYLSHAVALQAADFILINDLVALQKMLEHQLGSNPSLSYLFVLRDGQVLAHTFTGGIPAELIAANLPGARREARMQSIVSKAGDHYLDIALPVFEGKAGTLRLGFSEEPYRQEVTKLRLQMTLLTGAVLVLALAGSLLFVKQITDPLTELSQVVERVDRGDLDARVALRGEDEVAALGASFNHMVERLQSYTLRLEEQTIELEHAHSQTRTVCGLVQEIGALQSLQEIAALLVKKLSSMAACRDMYLMVLNEAGTTIFLLSAKETTVVDDAELVQNLSGLIESADPGSEPSFSEQPVLAAALLPEGMHNSRRQAFLPLFHHERPFGGLLVNCSGNPSCSTDELKMVALMLNQSAPVIKRALLHEEKIRDLQSRLETSAEFYGIVARDPKMQMIFRLLEDIAPTDASVLIQGESGTGKELVAKAIHQLSPRHSKPFIVINCSAYPSSLLESELFGHEKGAFTGAIRLKIGRFELADGGTVFLDEVGEIPPSAQIKLLRVLQTQEFERVGGEKSITVDVRILAATNKNLLDEVKKGEFREDLYYRLSVIPVFVPPLRDRRNDIPLLASHFLQHFAAAHGKRIESFTTEAMRFLLAHPWPGNVRELENTIEHAVALAKNPHIEPADLPAALRSSNADSVLVNEKPSTIAEHESELLKRVLDECGWNKKETAQRLGISRNTLYNKIKKYGIRHP